MAAQLQQPTRRVALGVLDVNLLSPVTVTSSKHASFSKSMGASSRPSLPLSPSISPVQLPVNSPLSGTKRKFGLLGEEAGAGPERRPIRHNGEEESLLDKEIDQSLERGSSGLTQEEEELLIISAQSVEADERQVLERESDQVILYYCSILPFFLTPYCSLVRELPKNLRVRRPLLIQLKTPKTLRSQSRKTSRESPLSRTQLSRLRSRERRPDK